MGEFIFARSAKGLELKTLEWWGNSQAWQEEEEVERSHLSCTQKMKEGRGAGDRSRTRLYPLGDVQDCTF